MFSLVFISPMLLLLCSSIGERGKIYFVNMNSHLSALTVAYLSSMLKRPRLLSLYEYIDCWLIVIQVNQAIVPKLTVVHQLELFMFCHVLTVQVPARVH
jgi:hypothetical protein